MTHNHLVSRIDRIAVKRHDRTIWDAAGEIATRHGVTPQEVMDEACRLHPEARRLGITAVEVVANECGMTVAEVWADVTEHWDWVERWGVKCAR